MSDPLIDELPSRYVVGIDLGTTNCAVGYIDTTHKQREIRILEIQQIVASGVSESRQTLPSFHFQPTPDQVTGDAFRLPWQQKSLAESCVGVMARDESAVTNGRCIASAKSWLCHAGVDRTAALLPWQGAADVTKLSPMEASSRYLAHIRDAWNHQFPNEPLENQDIVLTLPASFDEVARELTVQAAALAKLPRVILIEEPQAAFYSWVDRHKDSWQNKVTVGQKILVCDIGGGTTDFTLIKVRASSVTEASSRSTTVTEASSRSTAVTEASSRSTDTEPVIGSQNQEPAAVEFHRVAVGNHLILGGDNLDLALAKHVEAKFVANGQISGPQLSPHQWEALVGASRKAKESLLGNNPPEQVTINLPASGSKLIGGSLTTELTQTEIDRVIVDGFLPTVELTAHPEAHRSGFQEFGLPFASDPAITRHLAAFLTAHADPEQPNQAIAARPDVVMFNGGFFDSPVLRERVLAILDGWFGKTEPTGWRPVALDNDRRDLAVARGAAYYGMVRRGEGVRIAASLARSYYIAFDEGESASNQAVCLVPGEAQPGETFELAFPQFSLKLSQPVAFSLLVSSVRLTDQPGQILSIDREQMTPLPPIQTTISGKSRNEKRDVPVQLVVHLTEIGTLEISCHEIDSQRSWKLDFDIRSTVQTDVQSHTGAGEAEGFVDDATWERCQQAIEAVFGDPQTADADPQELMNRLTEILESDREQWPMSVLRRIWESLLQLDAGRKRSAKHESRWLNLLGFSLRPGYGYAVDDWRVTETWRAINGKLAHATPAIRKESLILWRRIAGGLTRGQQIALASTIVPSVRNLRSQIAGRTFKGVSLKPEESPEVWRLLASLELLPIEDKVSLGSLLTALLTKKSFEKFRDSIIWALGRLGQRQPVYGNLNTLVPPNKIEPWITQVIASETPQPANVHLAITQMSRLTGDRFRDLEGPLRQRVQNWLKDQKAAESLSKLVELGGQFDTESQQKIFGDSLPSGLQIR